MYLKDAKLTVKMVETADGKTTFEVNDFMFAIVGEHLVSLHALRNFHPVRQT